VSSLSRQAAEVLKIMRRDGHITRLIAMNYGIANLTARISELRDAGYAVICDERRDANHRRYGDWKLAKA
jgi:hypothetical protein